MKKSNYITKYTYIDYYLKQKAFWFFSNADILSSIELQYTLANPNSSTNFDDDYQNDEADASFEEFDTYEYFKELKDDFKDIDLKDPKIVEGNIIDSLSEKHIIESFSEIKNICNLEMKYNKSLEDKAIITQELLKTENIILFQPVFISDDKQLLTKPDAVVKIKNKLILIETKGTSTAKRHHFLDLYFQAQVLYRIQYLQDMEFSFKMCLVDYTYSSKNSVPLVLTDYINYKKTVSFDEKKLVSKSQDVKIEYKRLQKQGYGFIDYDSEDNFPLTITNLVNEDLLELEERYEAVSSSAAQKSITSAIALFQKVFNEFDTVISKLQNHYQQMLISKPEYCTKIVPSYNDKSDFKTSNFWLSLRKLYAAEKYPLLQYSGNIIDQSNIQLQNASIDQNIESLFKPLGKKYFTTEHDNIYELNNEYFHNLYIQLKKKKVYFDFETVNSAIRVINNSLPFMQIVSQCSIIKDIGDKNIDNCLNILLDPKNITIDDFKHIIDKLYMGSDYSYIVYNKAFERSRLKEMAAFINEGDYQLKVDTIVNRLYDLADFFTIKSKLGCPILIYELGGFYSIKKVLPFIEKNYKVFYNITKCKDYSKLEVKNGSECQNQTMLRLFDLISDAEWQTLENNLKIYCENDVRAMIAIEYFIHDIYQKEIKPQWLKEKT